MAYLCLVYGYTPEQVRSLSVHDADTLIEYAAGRKD